MRQKIAIKTNKAQEMINIDRMIEDEIRLSGIKTGRVFLFCPHTTAGLTINENGDSDVVRDILTTFEKVYPVKGDYRHFEGNSHAHIKSSLMGVEQTILIENGQLLLGTWQSIYFCEFDGPRNRKLIIEIVGE